MPSLAWNGRAVVCDLAAIILSKDKYSIFVTCCADAGCPKRASQQSRHDSHSQSFHEQRWDSAGFTECIDHFEKSLAARTPSPWNERVFRCSGNACRYL